MNPLVQYMLKTALCIAAFYTIYAVSLSRDTMHNRNRLFILIALLISLILPSFIIPAKQVINIQFPGFELAEIVINAPTDSTATEHAFFSAECIIKVVNIIYLAGVIAISLRLAMEMLWLLSLIVRKNKKTILYR